MQNATNHPLLIQHRDSSVKQVKIESGSTYRSYFHISNSGNKRAEINISLSAANKRSEPLQEWCTIEPHSLWLDAGDTGEIAVVFEIPQPAKPNRYQYEIFIEAPAHYPGEFFRYPQQIIIDRPGRDPQWGDAPLFSIQPPVNSTNPYRLSIGEKVAIKVTVENRSLLVDSFELSCPDLAPQWYTIHYPERDLYLPGSIGETEGLKLNPGKTGEIILVLHPPRLTLAGNYIRTIELTSQNREDLVLLDVLYLQILPDDTLLSDSINISPLERTLPKERGEFEIGITNQGNIQRNLTISIKDERNLFACNLDSNLLELLPGQTETKMLSVKPQWFWFWRRPLWGKALETKFTIQFQNTEGFVPITQKAPALPQNIPQGTIIWTRRPLWQLILLLVSGTSALGATVFYLWLSLWQLPPLPRIEAFAETKIVDPQTEEESIVLNWRVSNFQQLQKIMIVGTDENNIKEYKIYDRFQPCHLDRPNNCMPDSLISYCQIDRSNFECKGIPTDTKKPGKYTFELQLFSKEVRKLLARRDPHKIADSQLADTMAIAAAPVARILSEDGSIASKSNYQHKQTEFIEFKWNIDRFSKLKKIEIVRRGNDGKQEVYPYSISKVDREPERPTPQGRLDRLKCTDLGNDRKSCLWAIEAAALPLGNHEFELDLFSGSNLREPSDKLVTKNTITVVPEILPEVELAPASELLPISAPIPKIHEFDSNYLSYAEGESVTLDWKIEHPKQIEYLAVEAISFNGDISRQIAKYYPDKIHKICSSPGQQNEWLDCRRIPVGNLPAGNYNFKLIIVFRQQKASKEIVKRTNTVTIKPTFFYSPQEDIPPFMRTFQEPIDPPRAN